MITDDAAMSFEEIGRRLGVTRKAACLTYQRALYKLRQRPERLRAFCDLVRLRRQLEARRRASGFGVEE